MEQFKDKKILVLEDEPAVAALLKYMLEDLGCEVVGPVAKISDALAEVVMHLRLDAAVLDINIEGRESSAIAEALRSRGIPYLLSTGNAQGRSRAFGDPPVLEKPYDQDQLRAVLGGLLDEAAAEAVRFWRDEKGLVWAAIRGSQIMLGSEREASQAMSRFLVEIGSGRPNG